LKRLVFRLILLSSVVFLFVALANYIFDPVQYYRENTNLVYDYENQRFLYAGIVRNYTFDRIIVGNSMSENFLPSFVDSAFGYGRTLNASISGSSTYEQSVVLRLALSKKKVREVIWGIDFFSLGGTKEASKLPHHMYDDNKLNDLLHLFNPYVTRQIIKQILFRFAETSKKEEPFNYDKLTNYWFERYKFSETEVLKKLEAAEDENFTKNTIDLSVLSKSFDENILRLVKENPGVEFYLFFSPYSIIYFARMLRYDAHSFENIFSFKSFVVDTLTDYENAFIYDFQDMYGVMENLDNYKDATHYSLHISELIINSIVSNLRRGIKHTLALEKELEIRCFAAIEKYW